ncbi:hypothetical protein OIDMADRAFT_28885 [Oidiodendron maius Zn]|uniref:Uncharacterized protein n=1 Tax=Oidiodendron maius (strain Zn) TaxID=913774 RepID=A0A0C3DGT1_OIDMZ|nr:hypothetical protein OIDMADRAFT_28885 [Oidiodendron maius Zn]
MRRSQPDGAASNHHVTTPQPASRTQIGMVLALQSASASNKRVHDPPTLFSQARLNQRTVALPSGSGRPRLPRYQLEKTSAARTPPSSLLSSPLARRCAPIPAQVPHVCGLPPVPRVVAGSRPATSLPGGGTLGKGGCYMPLALTPTPSATPVSHAVQLPDSPGPSTVLHGAWQKTATATRRGESSLVPCPGRARHATAWGGDAASPD